VVILTTGVSLNFCIKKRKNRLFLISNKFYYIFTKKDTKTLVFLYRFMLYCVKWRRFRAGKEAPHCYFKENRVV